MFMVKMSTHLEYGNSLGRIWLLDNFKSVIEIGFNSGCWLLRIGKTIGVGGRCGGWMDNDVSLYYMLWPLGSKNR